MTSSQNDFANCFGTTGHGIFISLDIMFWIGLTCWLFYFLSITPLSFMHNHNHHLSIYPALITYIIVCWFSALLETLGTILKHKICMITACVCTAILFSLTIRVIRPAPIWDDLALIVSIWHFARFTFQIKVIRWISRNDAEEENGYIPVIPTQTVNGYQSI